MATQTAAAKTKRAGQDGIDYGLPAGKQSEAEATCEACGEVRGTAMFGHMALCAQCIQNEQLAKSVKWNNFVRPESHIGDDGRHDSAAKIDHAIIQLDLAPIGFGPRRHLNVAACGVRFAVVGGPVPMRPEQIRRRVEAGTICRECLRNTIGEIADGGAS